MILMSWMACSSAPTPLIDTGWFDETDTDPCADAWLSSTPMADEIWYHRDPIRLSFGPGAEPVVTLTDASGRSIPFQLQRSDVGGGFELRPDGALAPATDHVLQIVDCLGTHDVPFRTSDFGLPLQLEPSDLQGRTFSLALGDATWVEPAGIGGLLTLFLDQPALLDVAVANPSVLQLRFALGEEENGEIVPAPGRDVVSFPVVSFADRPYFDAGGERVVLEFSGTEIPIHQFRFSGTFAADGGGIGGGRVEGIADTRFAGGLVGDDRPGQLCDLAEGFGVQCEGCPDDDESYCLAVELVDVDGTWEQGITLTP